DTADTLFRHLHAHSVGLAAGDPAVHLVLAQMQAVTVVAWGLLAGHLLGAQLIQTFGSAEAAEGVALADQQLAVFPVDLAALALAVGAVGTANIQIGRAS